MIKELKKKSPKTQRPKTQKENQEKEKKGIKRGDSDSRTLTLLIVNSLLRGGGGLQKKFFFWKREGGLREKEREKEKNEMAQETAWPFVLFGGFLKTRMAPLPNAEGNELGVEIGPWSRLWLLQSGPN